MAAAVIKVTSKLENSEAIKVNHVAYEIALNFDQRKKSRLKIDTPEGAVLGLMLARGDILRGGDILKTEAQDYVRVTAAPEKVSTVYSDNQFLLCRGSYHLGNRHVSLEITPEYIRYQHDHVLDDMVRGLGLDVEVENAPFEPEAGAYATAGHHHEHKHHSHEH